MDPIRTVESNFTYLGPVPQVFDLPCQRLDGRVYSVWRLTDEERAAIAAGANIELGISREPIPPVSLAVTDAAEEVESEHGIDFRCEGCGGLYVEKRAARLDFDCGHCAGAPAVAPRARPVAQRDAVLGALRAPVEDGVVAGAAHALSTFQRPQARHLRALRERERERRT